MPLVDSILNFLMQKEQLQLQKEQSKLKQKEIGMAIEERDKRAEFLKTLPPDLQGIAMLHPQGAADILKLNALINTMAGIEKQEPPPTAEQTGELFRPTQEMVKTQPQYQQKPNLLGQLTQGQLGFKPEDIMAGMMKKEFGVENPKEAVQTGKEVTIGGVKYLGRMLRDGTTEIMKDQMGKPLIVPPKADWRKSVIGNQVVEIAFDETGNIVQQNGTPLIRANIPQEQQFLRGMSGGPTGQGTIPIPPGGFPPGSVLPESVKHEPLTMKGPRGEETTTYINPITGQPMKGEEPSGISPVSGIQTKPPQPQSVPHTQQVSMMQSGMESLKKIKDSIFDPKTGKINRTNLANSMLKIPRTEGKRVGDLIGAALNAIRLASTGAAFSEEELQQLKSQYIPSYLSNDDQVYDQWDMLTKFVNGMLTQLDPNEVYTKNQKQEFEKLSNVSRYKGEINLQPGKKEQFKKGQTIQKNNKTYKYIGDDKWEEQ